MSEPVIRRYTFKLYPTREQEAALVKQSALVTSLWNAALEQREIQWSHECQRKAKGDRKGLSFYDQSKELKFLRADDPEYAEMSSDTLGLVLGNLDLAFKAFFKRAKGGAGKSSGYPKYKSSRFITSVPFRNEGRGWKFHEGSGSNIRIYAKGIPGKIKGRGKFPSKPIEIRTMELIYRDGNWWMSVVAKMEARRSAGTRSTTVRFDLVDEFARVETRVDGGRSPGCEVDLVSMEERITTTSTGVNTPSVGAPSFVESDNGERTSVLKTVVVDAPSFMEGDNGSRDVVTVGQKVDTPSFMEGDSKSHGPSGPVHCITPSVVMGDNGTINNTLSGVVRTKLEEDHYETPNPVDGSPSDLRGDGSLKDSIQSEGDRRYKKFSYRWKQNKRRVAKRMAKDARRRQDALHNWSSKVISLSKTIEVISPSIKESTSTARGTIKNPGAAVSLVAALNRNILEQAPATAIQMMEYKAAEAGIPFVVIKDKASPVTIGKDIQVATKAVRKLKRTIKEATL